MRNRFGYLVPVFGYLGRLLIIFGPVSLSPVIVVLLAGSEPVDFLHIAAYLLPGLGAVVLGILSVGFLPVRGLTGREAVLVCALGWIIISAIGAVPFCILLNTGYLDACFESVSGFTTTGITMFSGLDEMPRSILFWRALTQWMGGLGILSFFLVLAFQGGAAHVLVGAEGHKIFSRRPAPGMFHTLRIIWFIYILFTVVIAALLLFEGLTVFDAVTHALTTLSTGGYSTHDSSVGYYRENGFAHYRLIEYTIILGMTLGGISFLVHYQVLRGRIGALLSNFEIRLFWLILIGVVALIGFEHMAKTGDSDIEATFRTSLFQTLAIITSAGFSTENIGDKIYFGVAARQIFLLLMIIGGCVGSTGGGLKVLRIGILFKMIKRQLIRITHPSSVVAPVVVDREIVPEEEVRRIATLFFAWMFLLAGGGIATAIFAGANADIGPYEAFSGMFSALGNIGPCYISADDMIALHPVVKIVYMFGMLAGRLEILPVLLLFSRRAWK
ncbi:MAG: TrkH family potassium uptake protein [Planctomycetota bacterium]|nr:MAG: TrkH family potassium uptake protein [Planctomycetota bacterium]